MTRSMYAVLVLCIGWSAIGCGAKYSRATIVKNSSDKSVELIELKGLGGEELGKCTLKPESGKGFDFGSVGKIQEKVVVRWRLQDETEDHEQSLQLVGVVKPGSTTTAVTIFEFTKDLAWEVRFSESGRD